MEKSFLMIKRFLMVIIYIWPLKLLSLIVHYKRLLRVNVFAIECIQTLRVSDFVSSVKTTAYDQNNNIQWYFHIFRAQKRSKSR